MGFFNIIARNNEKKQAPKPLIMTIEKGFFEDTFLVKLLSIPQQKQAPIMPNAPIDKPH